MSMKTLSAEFRRRMRDAGFDIEIEHTRPMVGFAAITESGPDTMLSRAEFNSAVENMKYSAAIHKKTEPTYGEFVSSCGGFTRVTLSKDGKTYVGKFNFGKKENFERAFGVTKAIIRAAQSVTRAK